MVVKEFFFESGKAKAKEEKKKDLLKKLESQRNALEQTCETMFSEMYEMYLHAKVTRLVVESNMRFGRDRTLLYSVETTQGKEKIVQDTLTELFGGKDEDDLYGTKDEIDDGEDFFPFIYVPVLTF